MTGDIWARIQGCIARAPFWLRAAVGLVVVYAAFYFLINARSCRYPYRLTPMDNPNVAEAAAILDGRLELELRRQDTALVEGRVYNVYPPMFTLISLAVLPWSPEGVPIAVPVLLALALPGLTYALFRGRTQKIWVAVAFALCYLFGTSMLPVLNRAVGRGNVYHVNHLLSQLGLLIFLLDYFGHRRIWLGGLGLLIAVWSRQLTAAYLIPLVFAAVAGRASAARWRRAGVAAFFAVVIAALPMALNALKFGHPLETGYRYVYAGWGAGHCNPAEDGVFAVSYVPRNLYYMNLGFPSAELVGGFVRPQPNLWGTGIWWTTPLLLYLWVDVRRWWADRGSRVLMLAAAIVVMVLLLYHATGWLQPGYNRFSLDYLVVMLAIIAPHGDGVRRRVFTPVLTAWSIWYFRWAI